MGPNHATFHGFEVYLAVPVTAHIPVAVESLLLLRACYDSSTAAALIIYFC